MPTTLPGVAADDAAVELRRQDIAIGMTPEVALVFGKVGRADTATDPAPFSMAETLIRLKPRSEWPKIARQRWYSAWAPAPLKWVLGVFWPERTERSPEEVIDSLDRATRLPGWINAWTAPVRARIDMMSTGVHTPVGVRIVARDPARLEALGTTVQAAVRRVPGTRTAVFESLGRETRLAFDADPAALARHHVAPALVRSTAELLLTGGELGRMRAADVGIRAAPGTIDSRSRTVEPRRALVAETSGRRAAGSNGAQHRKP